MKRDQHASPQAIESTEKAPSILPRVSAGGSGVLPRLVAPVHSQRPSWDEVDEYLREGKHRGRVERYAAGDPDFAEVLRWMRNELEAEEPDADSTRTPPPASFPGAFAQRVLLLPPNG